jgi:Tol biopolymer transport system component
MKTLSLFVCLSGLAGLLSAQNNNPSHPGRLLQVDDFSRFEDVADPELSPDGQWVLYTATTLDEPSQKRQSDIWQVKWDGSQKLRLTSSPDSESSLRWSPDGKYISFLSGRSGGPAKGTQVWVLDRQDCICQQSRTRLCSSGSGAVAGT